MDPADFREKRVTTGTTTTPAGAPEPAPGAYAPPAAPVAAPTTTTRTYASRTSVYSGSGRAVQVIWLLLGIVDVILALDFIFRAAGGANTGFAHYMYRIGGWLAAPFDGIFTNTALVSGRTFIRWADVLAVVIYSLIALAIAKLVQIISRPGPTGTPV
ncbi:MAG TPA: hypothetical protein VIG86_05950 [Candidatus Dormibacteraeota bacterium]|jgi:hypothetical protein